VTKGWVVGRGGPSASCKITGEKEEIAVPARERFFLPIGRANCQRVKSSVLVHRTKKIGCKVTDDVQCNRRGWS